MYRFNKLTTDKIAELLKVSRNTAFNIFDTIAKHDGLILGLDDVERILGQIDKLLWGHGVEYINHPYDSANRLEGCYGLSYCNSGEAYQTTVMFDHGKETFLIGDYGTFIEQNFPLEDGTEFFDEWEQDTDA